jgi:alanine-synthesizing transaminase
MFASRTRWDLEPNRLAQALDARRRAGLPVLDLTDSNPTRCGLAWPEAELRDVLAGGASSRYDPHPRGLPAAREAVAAHLRREGVDADAGRVVLTASTSEAYAFLFRLLADPGDAILVPRPSYPLFGYLAGLSDVRTVEYPLHCGDGGWRIDLDALRAAAGPDARAVIVVNPNNPTGSCVDAGERRAILDLARTRGLAVIADEVFAAYPFADAAAPARLSGATEALTFGLGGLSKDAGLPQLKLSWILATGPEDRVCEALARLDVIADTYLSVGTPVQLALPALLARSGAVRDAIRARVRSNRRVAAALAAGQGLRLLPADAGWVAVLASEAPRDDEAWALELLERDGVLVHPGHFYDFDEEGRLVVSLLVPPATLETGIRCIAARAV